MTIFLNLMLPTPPPLDSGRHEWDLSASNKSNSEQAVARNTKRSDYALIGAGAALVVAGFFLTVRR
ncbi:hypothetical protein [Spirosoma areae]